MVYGEERNTMKITLRVWILIIALMLAVLMISPSFKSGAVIKSVDQNSTAYQEGVRQGMVITEINDQKVENMEDYSSAVLEIFATGGEKRISIKTQSEEFIFLTETLPITVGNLPKSKIKTGLDLSGGARALVKAVEIELDEQQIAELVAITSQRLNAFGITDVNVRPVKDLSGSNFMLVEIAGATPEDIKDLLGKQGKFEAKVGNQSVFEGGEKDISDVCRNDASCAGIQSCFPSTEGYACNFAFTIYLTEDAAKKHADITDTLGFDDTGQYLNESLYLYVDDIEVDSLLISSGLKGQVTTQISIQGSGSGISQQDAIDDSRANMNRLQTILITGSLPYKLEIVKLDSISPFLGKEFSKGLIMLGLIVFIIVSLSIFIRYRRIKITLAVILTMFSELLITLGIAALIKWNLDAPAIAGIIAGIGTGVNDQIVLIEESSEKESARSTKEKVKRALFIIFGAFLTIVAAMLPLLWAGAGLLRGFAFTTIIGITVGILITRPAFADIIRNTLEQ